MDQGLTRLYGELLRRQDALSLKQLPDKQTHVFLDSEIGQGIQVLVHLVVVSERLVDLRPEILVGHHVAEHILHKIVVEAVVVTRASEVDQLDVVHFLQVVKDPLKGDLELIALDIASKDTGTNACFEEDFCAERATK